MVRFICERGRFVDGGLKVQAVPTGSPLQPKVTIPSVESSSSTSKTKDAEEPAVTVAVAACEVITIGGPQLTGSLGVSFPVLVFPPPETVALLVKLVSIFIGTMYGNG